MNADHRDEIGVTPAQVGGHEQSSIWRIIAGVFTGPGAAFAGFNQKPRILTVLIIGIILGGAVAVLTMPYSAKVQYDIVSQSTTIPPQALEQMRESAENPKLVSGAIFGGVMLVIMGLIGALLAWGIGSFIMGGNSTFKKIWGVTLLGGLIPAVGGLIKMPLIIAKNSLYVSFGLAAFLPGRDFTSVLYMLFYYFDAFAIWGLIVTGIGYAAVFNISRGRGIITALIASLIIIGFSLGLQIIGMSFAGVKMSFF
jgi:membrane protein, antimicrobial resistance system